MRIHLMGICGTAMASLAGILKDLGHEVRGSDQNVYPPMSTQLESLGIPLMEGYKPENLQWKPDLVIVGNVIRRDNPEAQALLASELPYKSLPAAMGEFVIDQRQSLVITGTHGKTTTTAMIAKIADQCGLQAGFMVGGIPVEENRSFRAPQGDWFIIEGDEYDTAFFDKVPKFLHYRPRHVIFTSLEFDHADIYDNLDQIKKGFIQLMSQIPDQGTLVVNGDDPEVLDVARHWAGKYVTYGMGQKSSDGQPMDYSLGARQSLHGRNQFSVFYQGQAVADVALKQFGHHNSMNALAAFAMAHQLKWPLHLVLQGLAGFKGVKRRQEIIGEPRGITLVEDFAHHPTAVELTVASTREQFPGRRILAVFEPRSATSRRNIFQKQYVQALSGADLVYVAQPYDQSRIPESERFSCQQLLEDLGAQGVPAHSAQNVQDLVKDLKAEAGPQDVILLMSNGGFDNIYSQLLDALS